MTSSDPSSPSKEQISLALLNGIALLLVLGGQFVFYIVPQGQPYGLIGGLLLSALGVLLFIAANAGPLPRSVGRLIARWQISPTWLWLGAAAALAGLTVVVSVAFEQFGQTNYLPVIFFWLASGACYLAALACHRQPGDWRGWLRGHRNELLLVGALTLVAGVLRFYMLGAIPRIINGDEGVLGQAALLTDRLPLANPFALSANFGAVYLQLINLSIWVFGRTPFALRLLPAIGGTLAIPALYGLTRRLFGIGPAFLAAALLAMSHMHLQFSRTVPVGYIQDTLLMPLELYFLISGLENRSPLRAGVGGLLLGLHFSIYLGAQVIASCLLVYLVVAAVICRPLVQKALRPVMAFWGGMGVMALPLVVYSWRHPNEFLARLNADGTFQSGWLSQTMAATGQNALQVLAGRVVHAFLSLIYYPAIEFYGTLTPPLSLITATLFLLGLGLALWRTRQASYLLLNGYFWSIPLAVGIFSIPPGADSYRMLMALPAALILAAIGFDQLLTWAASTARAPWLLRAGVTGFTLLGLLSINFWTYYVDFAGRCRYGGDPQTRFASYLGNYLRQVEPDTKVYLLSDDVFRYGTHSSVDFLSRSFPVKNVPEALATWNPPPHSLLIAPPSRIAELTDWADQHPGGKLHHDYDCANSMLAVYTLPQ